MSFPTEQRLLELLLKTWKKIWPIADRRVPSNHPRNNCRKHFSCSRVLVSVASRNKGNNSFTISKGHFWINPLTSPLHLNEGIRGSNFQQNRLQSYCRKFWETLFGWGPHGSTFKWQGQVWKKLEAIRRDKWAKRIEFKPKLLSFCLKPSRLLVWFDLSVFPVF